jgi:hypothetical protein
MGEELKTCNKASDYQYGCASKTLGMISGLKKRGKYIKNYDLLLHTKECQCISGRHI